MLLNVFPKQVFNNAVNGISRNVIAFCDDGLFYALFVKSANFSNFCVIQFGLSVIRAVVIFSSSSHTLTWVTPGLSALN